MEQPGPSPTTEDQILRDIVITAGDLGPALVDLELEGRSNASRERFCRLRVDLNILLHRLQQREKLENVPHSALKSRRF